MKFIPLAMLLFIAFPRASYAQSTVFRLDQLWCNKTTEEGEDEIYFIVTFRYNFANGNFGQYVTQRYNMNDGRQPRQIGGINLFQGQLLAGASVDVTVMIMEEDGGGSQQIINRAKTVMEYGAPTACMGFPPSCPYAMAIGGVVEFVSSLPQQLQGIIQDSDDYIGSINVRMTNTNGHFSAQFFNTNRCASTVFLNGMTNVNQSVFVGDGSNYIFTATTGLQ